MPHASLIGKGWAKGLTQEMDRRIARRASAHRGLVYRRRTPPYLWSKNRGRGELRWTGALAYATGLAATDGCLVADGRHLSFGSRDRALVQSFIACVGRRDVARRTATPLGEPYYRVQFGDVYLYRWFTAAGLTPRKSLTLGALAVPDALLFDLTRGLLDGDGSVLVYPYAGTGKARGRTYSALRVHFNSASRPHVDWLRERLRDRLGIAGSLGWIPESLGSGLWRLQYANRESETLLGELYRDPDAPCLRRKRASWSRWRATSSAAVPTRASGSAR